MSREVIGRVDAGSERAGVRTSAAAAPARALVLAALAAVAVRTGFRTLHNAPVVLPTPVVGSAAALGIAAGVLPGIAAVALGLRSGRPADRVGLSFAGVFGALATVVPAVTVPAAVALVGGGALAVARRVRPIDGWRGALGRAVPAALLGGVALALGAATGLLPPGTRTAGASIVVAALAASPALVRPGPTDWALGALAGAGVLWAGSSLPFVAGAVTLVAFGLVGTPLALFAAGVGGGVATVAGSLGREASGSADWLRGVGAALVLLAGVPATVGGATAIVLGSALLAGVGAGGDRR